MNSSLEVERDTPTPHTMADASEKANEGRGYSSVGKITAMDACEDRSSILRIHIKKPDRVECPCNPNREETRQEDPGVYWPASLA